MKTVEEYLNHLESKGFQFREDAKGFVYFGKQYTNASDELANAAIEITLKAQKAFDGSFYVSLLEMLIANGITTRKEALHFIKQRELLAI
ncbi:DUF6123 family protein [Bacillus infantis]|uniref:DUF6123 family protein n=1 Tax=Bacillus infantis TaxID=324767 RepID=UPI001CD3403E|nr:DUF6123 family protein [Bacillus infantis]MCA1039885.1 DUF6123 family protein [Bacillus infantis]